MDAFKTSVGSLPTVLPDPDTYEEVSDAGRRTLWVVFVIMFLSSLAFIFMAWRTPVQKRLFHQITALITIFATLSYFAMATGDGISLVDNIHTHKHKHGVPDTHVKAFREVYWARYVDWSLTTPLLLLDLALLAGMNGSNILTAIVADEIMILTGLFAAFGKTSGTKWGWYAMGCAAFLAIIWNLAVGARRTAKNRDEQVGKFFTYIAGYTLILWTLYPVVWGVGDGARRLSVDAEVLSYAILDVLAKPVFGFWLLIAHQRMPASGVSLNGVWAHGLGNREGSLRVGDDDDEA